MFNSIRFKLFSVFLVLLLVFTTIFLVSNSYFLDDIFLLGNKRAMNNMYDKYKETIEQGNNEEELLYGMAEEFGGNITIIDMNYNTITTTSYFNRRQDNPYYKLAIIKSLSELKNKDTIFKVWSPENQQSNIVFAGKVSPNRLFIAEKSLMSVQNSSEMAKQFIIISGLGTLIIGSILVYFLSKRLTNPIVEINNVAKGIANLNFNKKVDIKSNDELGRLGNSINDISDELSITIKELKIANSKLKEDIEREKRLEKMRRKFVSNVSHELKTPISMIKAYADGLKFSIAKNPEDMEYYTDVIIDESNKMNKLIKDLLHLSSYQSGSFTIQKENFDLKNLLENIIEKYKRNIEDKKIDLQVNTPEECNVYADKIRIEQVITNFMNNALNHVYNSGQIIVNLTDNDENIHIDFYNSGDKIDESDIENIWDSFYKSQNNTSNTGTGLGLAIVKAIVNLHSGDYGVENKENGVNFWIELPKDI